MKILMLLVMGILVVSAATAKAGVDNEAILGGLIGGGTGAALGSAIGGRNGAIIGGAIGGAAGVATATADRGRAPLVGREGDGYYRDNGWHRGYSRHRHEHEHEGEGDDD